MALAHRLPPIRQDALTSDARHKHARRNRELAQSLKDHGSTYAEVQLSGLRTVRSDCGTEFLNSDMKKILAKVGAKVDPVAPYKKDVILITDYQ